MGDISGYLGETEEGGDLNAKCFLVENAKRIQTS